MLTWKTVDDHLSATSIIKVCKHLRMGRSTYYHRVRKNALVALPPEHYFWLVRQLDVPVAQSVLNDLEKRLAEARIYQNTRTYQHSLAFANSG